MIRNQGIEVIYRREAIKRMRLMSPDHDRVMEAAEEEIASKSRYTVNGICKATGLSKERVEGIMSELRKRGRQLMCPR
jgi:hypothetical protein